MIYATIIVGDFVIVKASVDGFEVVIGTRAIRLATIVPTVGFLWVGFPNPYFSASHCLVLRVFCWWTYQDCTRCFQSKSEPKPWSVVAVTTASELSDTEGSTMVDPSVYLVEGLFIKYCRITLERRKFRGHNCFSRVSRREARTLSDDYGSTET